MRHSLALVVLGSLGLLHPSASPVGAEPEKKVVTTQGEFTRKDDVIYARHQGVAFTMDVFTPKERLNRRGVVWCISAGWVSDKELIKADAIRPFLKRGYVVFAVMHGSQPKYTIPEIVEQMHRSVQYIRAHAEEYGVDPERLGITGGSAGGHLSILMATSGRPARPDAKDEVSRQSSRVAACGCFFPPTDFANYGKEGESVIGRGGNPVFMGPFDFKEFDGATGKYLPMTEKTKIQTILRAISPTSYVSKDSAPALIFHGDADVLVPFQQSELIVEKYKRGSVPCELVVKKGAGHGWQGMDADVERIADWFDKYLEK